MAQTQEKQRGHLRKNAINVVGAVALSMAFMGPATSAFFNTAPVAGAAGYALPFALILALIVALLVASAIGAFAQKIATAGFAYTFNTYGFGKKGGFLSGWILIFAYAMVGPMLLSGIGALTQAFVQSATGVDVPWWIFTNGRTHLGSARADADSARQTDAGSSLGYQWHHARWAIVPSDPQGEL
ncbi:MAG TPA: hypothetical protein VHZ51_10580 [Ktedonobacteraceae bacterium]|jgi:amino acid transporter|nr:hypothetical protein [Ktedonobacteraceae bacterium]